MYLSQLFSGNRARKPNIIPDLAELKEHTGGTLCALFIYLSFHSSDVLIQRSKIRMVHFYGSIGANRGTTHAHRKRVLSKLIADSGMQPLFLFQKCRSANALLLLVSFFVSCSIYE